MKTTTAVVLLSALVSFTSVAHAVDRTVFGSQDCYAKNGSSVDYDVDFAAVFGVNYSYGYIFPFSGGTGYEVLAWSKTDGPFAEAEADSYFDFDGNSTLTVELEAEAWGFNYYQVGNGSNSGQNGYVAMLPTSANTWTVYTGGIFNGQFPSSVTAVNGKGKISTGMVYQGNGEFRIQAYTQGTAFVRSWLLD